MQNNGGCSEGCVVSEDDTVLCFCPPGSLLMDDGITCQGPYTVMNKSLRPLKIFANFEAQCSIAFYLRLGYCFILYIINHKHMGHSMTHSKQIFT